MMADPFEESAIIVRSSELFSRSDKSFHQTISIIPVQADDFHDFARFGGVDHLVVPDEYAHMIDTAFSFKGNDIAGLRH